MRKPSLALGMVVAATLGCRGRAEDNIIHWLGDYGEALREAKQTQKPIFLEFRCEA